VAGSCEHGNKSSDIIKTGEGSLDQLCEVKLILKSVFKTPNQEVVLTDDVTEVSPPIPEPLPAICEPVIGNKWLLYGVEVSGVVEVPENLMTTVRRTLEGK
jgi:hypothetical protein